MYYGSCVHGMTHQHPLLYTSSKEGGEEVGHWLAGNSYELSRSQVSIVQESPIWGEGIDNCSPEKHRLSPSKPLALALSKGCTHCGTKATWPVTIYTPVP